jgi:hypothetical protein
MARARDVRVLRGDLSGLSLPNRCAACGEEATRALPLRATGHPEIAVPYCTRCSRRLARHGTLVVALTLSSSLVAVCFAFAFPLLWPWSDRATHALAAVLASLIPLALGWALFGEVGGGWQASVWWLPDGRLACHEGPFARGLASDNSLDSELCRGRSRRVSPWLVAGPVLGLLASGPAHHYRHARLVVLNVSGRPFSLHVDGRFVLRAEPTSAESPGSAHVARIPAGTRHLQAVLPEGGALGSTTATLRISSDHLYAPGSEGRCFWLERTGYGRQRGRRLEALRSSSGFFRPPVPVDSWFLASPEPVAGDDRSSGGSLVALRHSACEDAPRQVGGSGAPAAGP